MAKKEIKEKNKKSYFKDFKAELKKVIWPTPKQLINNTVAVLAIVLVTVVIVFVLDVIFDAFNKNVITSLQAKVESSTSEEATNVTSDSDEEASNTEESDTETTDTEQDSSEENVSSEENQDEESNE